MLKSPKRCGGFWPSKSARRRSTTRRRLDQSKGDAMPFADPEQQRAYQRDQARSVKVFGMERPQPHSCVIPFLSPNDVCCCFWFCDQRPDEDTSATDDARQLLRSRSTQPLLQSTKNARCH
jgi:hypothetical protein